MALYAQEPNRLVVLAAGGTGGHLFPAQALAEALVRRGYVIHLMTDERVRDYGRSFPAIETHLVPAATISPSKPHLLPAQLLRLYKGYRAARAVLERLKPVALAGFGGYPSFPPVIAASRLGIPCCIHDQNAVMGRANRVLSRYADAVASSFPALVRLPEASKAKLRYTGNPVRSIVLEKEAAPYQPAAADEPFNLLVFGGSQGARFFAEFMPEVIKLLPKAVLRNLKIVQQCRPEDIERVKAAYAALEIAFELASFFADMPQRFADAQLVVCRSGASTIAELGVIGRPAVMVPLPHALDNDQLHNAEFFAGKGGGWVRPQGELTPQDFAAFLTRLRYQDDELAGAARAALAQGMPDAAERLADLVEDLAHRPRKTETREK
jgi:UDP-N-acetylglucosamine--N-acetylmuramyl-(pentapeptide) pyrophosphoryl-undecaprenol N-acetylglucosamine transferase